MKTFLTCLLSTLLLSLLSLPLVRAQSYQLVWADEFNNGIGPDWRFETGNNNGWGNNERQYYQAANARAVNGELQITARRENVGGFAYTSARMKTQGVREFKYGKVEARIKMPQGQGLWPAFWMLGGNIGQVGWPACGEIDVMEHINAENKVYGTVHWDNNGHAQYSGNTATSPQNYHVYTIEWEPSYIRWFVDGIKYHEITIANNAGGTEEFQRPFFLLLNLAVGGDWPGQTIDNSRFPATMSVDYVRVYQQGVTPAFSRQLEAEAANVNNGMVVENCSEGGQDMGYVDAGDYLVWNNINFPTSGTYNIEYRMASGAGGGTISADLNGGSIQLGSTTVGGTGGWQNWTTVSKTVTINAGTYNFGIYAQSGGWNLNWVRITQVGSNRPATITATGSALAGQFRVYPNPRPEGSPLTIELADLGSLAPATVQLLDLSGREVWRTTTTQARVSVAADLRLSAGTYLVQVTTTAGKSVQKVVIQ
ncbi:glycoside hydrolase family 16 [Hymenobacter amundsenii]|uniref:Glycoside hydrolase family 16 n=1 Tax=Hymenobacter amundsenii TaxID=2006685 RepID=A0A246FN47_9BACT|nr:family 16 glycosylhydrolase [Hymenobacter amundsenii]OWP64150.1 glycoside hydrolase family 16 [Hymenobacter amundsenii]